MKKPIELKYAKPTKKQIKSLEIVNRITQDKSHYDPIPNRKATTVIINNCDLRYSHYLLGLIAEKKGHPLDQLKKGRAVAFFNCSKTAVKLFFNPKTMIYHRQNGVVSETIVHDIHKTVVNGGEANWDKSTERVLIPLLKKKNRAVTPQETSL